MIAKCDNGPFLATIVTGYPPSNLMDVVVFHLLQSDDGNQCCKYGGPQGAQITADLCWCNPNYPVNQAGYPYAGIDCNWNTPIGQTMSSAYITINNQTPVVGDEFTSPCPGINANGTNASHVLDIFMYLENNINR